MRADPMSWLAPRKFNFQIDDEHGGIYLRNVDRQSDECRPIADYQWCMSRAAG